MSKKRLELQDDFLKKRRTLKDARKVLKGECISIDPIIDEIIDNVSSWFMISHVPEESFHQFNTIFFK